MNVKISKIFAGLSKIFLVIFFVLLVFCGVLLYNYFFLDNYNSLSTLIKTFAPATFFIFLLSLLFKQDDINISRKIKIRKIITFAILVISIFFYLLFFSGARFRGAKIFFSNGRIILYTTDENDSYCIDWCTPVNRLYVPFRVIYARSNSIADGEKRLETKLSTCYIKYDREYKFKIVYRNGGYWYKSRLKDSTPGCRLTGYIYQDVKSYYYDVTEVKESFVDYDCDKKDDVEGIYEKARIFIYSNMFKRHDIIKYEYPSKQDMCKYIKWKDTGDVQNCLTINNKILKENCGVASSTAADKLNIDNQVKNIEAPSINDRNIPRIMYWSGKVNQHWDLEKGVWLTDPDGVSGARVDKLVYCRKFYPTTDKVVEYKNEFTDTWRDSGNLNSYEHAAISYRCVLSGESI